MSEKIVGIVGGGLMGVGIAIKFALTGYKTVLYEAFPARRTEIPAAMQEILGELIEENVLSPEKSTAAVARILLTADFAALKDAAIIIEAIPEVLPLKQELYQKLEALVSPSALIASNTSGFMPDVLSAKMAHRGRFLITHFWNPPHAVRLVEVVPGSATTQAYVDLTMKVMREIGSEPVLLRTPLPGFIGNRLQYAVLREALHIVHSGAADAATVDTVMKASLGPRYSVMGPLEAADFGGLETFLKISTHLMPELAKDEGMLELLRQHVDKGEKGAATGRGFYEWPEAKKRAIRKKRLQQYLRNRTP